MSGIPGSTPGLEALLADVVAACATESNDLAAIARAMHEHGGDASATLLVDITGLPGSVARRGRLRVRQITRALALTAHATSTHVKAA